MCLKLFRKEFIIIYLLHRWRVQYLMFLSVEMAMRNAIRAQKSIEYEFENTTA